MWLLQHLRTTPPEQLVLFLDSDLRWAALLLRLLAGPGSQSPGCRLHHWTAVVQVLPMQ